MNKLKELLAALAAATTEEARADILRQIDEETTRIENETKINPDDVLSRVGDLLKGDKGDGDETTLPKKDPETTDPQVALLLGKIKKLEEDAEEKDRKLQAKEAADAKAEAVAKILPGLEKPFGKLTAKLMAESYVNSDKLKLDEHGVEQLLMDGKTYSGAAALEQLLTIHKSDIVGEPGSETRPNSKEVKPATAETVEGKSGYQLLDMALQEQGI